MRDMRKRAPAPPRLGLAIAVIAALAGTSSAGADEKGGAVEKIAFSVRAPVVKVGAPGGEGTLAVVVTLAKGVQFKGTGPKDNWHAYHPDAEAFGYIPLSLAAPKDAPYEIVKVAFPPPSKIVDVAGDKVPFYEGEVVLETKVKLRAGAPAKAATAVVVNYQICFGKDRCELPAEKSVPFTIEVGKDATPVPVPDGGTRQPEPEPHPEPRPQPQPQPPAGGGGDGAASTSTSTTPASAPAPAAEAAVKDPPPAPTPEAKTGPGPYTRKWVVGDGAETGKARRAVVVEAFIAFLAGLGIAFTPCVFPLVPVTVSYFSRQVGSKAWTLALTSAYAVGIATTYSILGVLSALAGAQLGDVLNNPYLVWFFVALFVVLASSMFGAFELALPSSLTTKIQGTERKGLFGALFLGLTLGLVAAPCVGPVASGLILFVANTRDWVFGLIVFFAFGLGLSTPFMALGTFSGALSALPRAGAWMEGVKKVFGFVLLAMALYFAANVVESEKVLFALLGVLVFTGGVFAGAFTPLPQPAKGAQLLRKSIGLLLVLPGVYFAFGPYVLKESGDIVPPQKLFKSDLKWEKDHDAALVNAEGKKPVMVDFYATYCAPCRELDLLTFSDPEVKKELERFVTVKQDLADARAKKVKEERYTPVEQFGASLPLVVFYDSRGYLHAGKAVREFMDAKKFLALLKEIR
jgi:thiol:disulfide interchange protein DsbD